jgi:CRISPR-associated endonuclease/helicase Cas3
VIKVDDHEVTFETSDGFEMKVPFSLVVKTVGDLDFDMGFRDLGPIDSIVQVAGRINRENSAERKGSPLYVVDLGDCQTIYGVMTDIQARFVLDKNPNVCC